MLKRISANMYILWKQLTNNSLIDTTGVKGGACAHSPPLDSLNKEVQLLKHGESDEDQGI